MIDDCREAILSASRRVEVEKRQRFERKLSAYLFLHLGEQMPEDAPDDWFLGPDPVTSFIKDHIRAFIDSTDRLMHDLQYGTFDGPSDIMSQFYDAAKRTFDGDKSLIRTYFQWMYIILLQKPDGPRWGEFVSVYGVDSFVEMYYDRLNNLC